MPEGKPKKAGPGFRGENGEIWGDTRAINLRLKRGRSRPKTRGGTLVIPALAAL